MHRIFDNTQDSANHLFLVQNTHGLIGKQKLLGQDWIIFWSVLRCTLECTNLVCLDQVQTMFRLDLNLVGYSFKPKNFIFKVTQCIDDHLVDLTKTWWNKVNFVRCGAFILSKKLMHFKARLHHWPNFTFGSIKLKKLAFLNDLETLDLVKESRNPLWRMKPRNLNYAQPQVLSSIKNPTGIPSFLFQIKDKQLKDQIRLEGFY